LDEAQIGSQEPDADLVALDDALIALASVDPRKSRVVELRFFGGLSVEETAEVLKVSPDTVHRDWRLAKNVASAGDESNGERRGMKSEGRWATSEGASGGISPFKRE